ncbi:hypothetical protein [Methanotorris formicicus]
MINSKINLLLIIDDHSRYILHVKLYEEATSDVVISTLKSMGNLKRY